MTASSWTGQPPITPGSGILSTDWLAGPSDGTQSPVLKLAESWPIMRGAVGLWLWGNQVEWRGGSLSIWDSHADLRRFIRWPVHVAIMKNWRGRIKVRSASWDDERFVPAQAWLRAEQYLHDLRDE